ncbi:MAG: hypothetical protein U0800_23975 [Isosphaeraceae bacterium]
MKARRPFAIRLRWWLIGLLPIGVGLYLWADQPHRRGRAGRAVHTLGGHAQWDDEHDPMRPAPASPGIASSMLRAWIGREFAEGLTVANLDGKPVRDDDLRAFEGLKGLQRLYLNGTPITDAGLTHIRRCPDLERLELRETGITDAGLKHLEGLDRLEELYLYGTPITDDGLKSVGKLGKLRILSLRRTAIGDDGLRHLAGLAELQELYLEGTRVTDEGIRELKQALPSLRLVRSK